jgi:hypothetical protein
MQSKGEVERGRQCGKTAKGRVRKCLRRLNGNTAGRRRITFGERFGILRGSFIGLVARE